MKVILKGVGNMALAYSMIIKGSLKDNSLMIYHKMEFGLKIGEKLVGQVIQSGKVQLMLNGTKVLINLFKFDFCLYSFLIFYILILKNIFIF